MAHQIVTWRLHRKGVILAVFALLVFSILVFAAGYMTALMRNPSAKPVAAKTTTAAKPPAATPGTAPTTTTTTQAAMTTRSAPPPSVPLTLRLAVFASEEEAKAYVKELAAVELKGTIAAMPTRDGPVLYAVESGQYKTRQEALAAAEILEREHAMRPTVVPASKRKMTGASAP
jgi:septal ring-binding cell division protein DamX